MKHLARRYPTLPFGSSARVKRFSILGFFSLLLFIGIPAAGQCSGSPYCQLNPPPPNLSIYPFTNSAANKRLPADKMSHLLYLPTYGIPSPGACSYGGTGSDCMAANTLCWGASVNTIGCETESGIVRSANSNGGAAINDNNGPLYYTGAPDPNTGSNDLVYSMCGALYDPNVCIIFHAPNNAPWSGIPAGDRGFGVWDVTWGILVGASGEGTQVGIGVCPGGGHAGTASDPCPVNGGNGLGYTQVAAQLIGVDKDWNWTSGTRNVTIGGQTTCCGGFPLAVGYSGDNMSFFAAKALSTSIIEQAVGPINHATEGTLYCVNPTVNSLFPSIPNFSGSACKAGSWAFTNGTAPGGSHFFTDYTDAQIAAMNLSPWQSTLLTQTSHYGWHASDYGGDSFSGTSPLGETTEDGLGYSFQVGVQNPLYLSFFNNQNMGGVPTPCGNNLDGHAARYSCEAILNSSLVGMLYGIPLVNGTDILSHIHILDPNAEPVLAMFGRSWTWAGGALPSQATGEIEIQIVGIVGGGTVTSNPAGSDCDHTGYCEIGYATGTPIKFTAIPNSGFTFVGWSGSRCSGTGTCTITTATGPAQQATARFLIINH
jgi:hypothetical protein